jgi:hypothetical protein
MWLTSALRVEDRLVQGHVLSIFDRDYRGRGFFEITVYQEQRFCHQTSPLKDLVLLSMKTLYQLLRSQRYEGKVKKLRMQRNGQWRLFIDVTRQTIRSFAFLAADLGRTPILIDNRLELHPLQMEISPLNPIFYWLYLSVDIPNKK